MEGQNVSWVYHPRKPKDSPLWHLLEPHFDEFEQVYEDRFVREYGFYRQVVSDVVRGYLKCGDLADGFARVRCPGCHHEYLLAFSCRGRWFCPSCHAKKVVQFGQHLRDNLLYPYRTGNTCSLSRLSYAPISNTTGSFWVRSAYASTNASLNSSVPQPA